MSESKTITYPAADVPPLRRRRREPTRRPVCVYDDLDGALWVEGQQVHIFPRHGPLSAILAAIWAI